MPQAKRNETAKKPLQQRKKRKRAGLWWLLLLVPVLVAAVYLFWWPGTLRDAPAVEVPRVAVGHRVGQQAPDFTLPTLTGNPVSLSDYRGRVVLLDFWASWCIPCRLTMPVLEDLSRQYPEIVLLGVSLDRSRSDAVAYLDSREESSLIAVYGSLSAASSVSQLYAVTGIPRTFLIDRAGIVRFADHPANLTATAIEALL